MPILKIVLKTPTKLTMDLSSKLNIQKSVELQDLDITPTEETQTYSPVKPYDGFGTVSVKPIPSEYIVPQGTITISGTEPTNVREYEYAQVEQPVDELDLIRFYDYDGTLLYTYTRSEIEALDELPSAPEHERLLFQEWNWSLEDLKALERGMDVGATYTTKSGKLEIDIVLTPATGLTFNFYNNYNATVDWGDGVEDNSDSHTYTEYGSYKIVGGRINNNTYFFKQSSSTHNRTVVNIALSTRDRISGSAFAYCDSLLTVTLPKNTINNGACQNLFYIDRVLKAVVMPSDLTQLLGGTFANSYGLAIISLPKSLVRINNDFTYLYGLEKIKFPPNITTMGDSAISSCSALKYVLFPSECSMIGTNIFSSCYSLQKVNLGNKLTQLRSGTFSICYALQEIVLPDTVTVVYNSLPSNSAVCKLNIPTELIRVESQGFIGVQVDFNNLPSTLTFIGNDAFKNTLTTNIVIPDSVTSIGSSAFNGCRLLTSFAFGRGINTIPNSVLSDCSKLQSIYLPNTILTINANAFNNCYSMRKYDFSQFTAIPTLANINAFNNINAQCKIVVPDELYDEWIAATNWATYANYIYKASEV